MTELGYHYRITDIHAPSFIPVKKIDKFIA